MLGVRLQPGNPTRESQTGTCPSPATSVTSPGCLHHTTPHPLSPSHRKTPPSPQVTKSKHPLPTVSPNLPGCTDQPCHPPSPPIPICSPSAAIPGLSSRAPRGRAMAGGTVGSCARGDQRGQCVVSVVSVVMGGSLAAPPPALAPGWTGHQREVARWGGDENLSQTLTRYRNRMSSSLNTCP